MPSLSDEYRPETYGDRVADVYDEFTDEFSGEGQQLDQCVEFLARLAGDGPVLELGIGTGRVALPLRERGIDVHGIDASERMVKQLRAKPGGDSVPVNIGDMSQVAASADQYVLIFVVINTFFLLPTQEDQINCFANVADRLDAGGRFVLHCFVPDLELFSRRQRVGVTRNDVDRIVTDYSTVDPVAQLIKSHRVVISGGQVTTYPVFLRYCWPGELDLMARLAGMELEQRWADWTGAEFTSQSGMHASVYKKG